MKGMPLTIGSDSKVAEAEKIFMEKKVSVLFILEDKKLAGIISHYDI